MDSEIEFALRLERAAIDRNVILIWINLRAELLGSLAVYLNATLENNLFASAP